MTDNAPIIPDDGYVDIGSGFNSGDGDPLRTSFDKINTALSDLDEDKANLDEPEFRTIVKAKNSYETSPNETDTLTTITDVKKILKDSPDLKDANLGGSETTVDSTLKASEDATIEGNVTIKSDTTIDANLDISGSINSVDSIDASNTISTNEGVSARGDISTSGGGVSASGDISTSGGDVSGTNIEASNNVTAQGDVLPEGDVDAGGDLLGNSLETDNDITSLSGKITANEGDIEAKEGDVSAGGNVSAKENVSAQGDLDVEGNGDIAGDLTVHGSDSEDSGLRVDNNASVSGNLDVGGEVSPESVNATNDISAGGSLEVEGSGEISGSLTVFQPSLFEDRVEFNSTVEVQGETTLNDSVTMNSSGNGTLTVEVESDKGEISFNEGSTLTIQKIDGSEEPINIYNNVGDINIDSPTGSIEIQGGDAEQTNETSTLSLTPTGNIELSATGSADVVSDDTLRLESSNSNLTLAAGETVEIDANVEIDADNDFNIYANTTFQNNTVIDSTAGGFDVKVSTNFTGTTVEFDSVLRAESTVNLNGPTTIGDEADLTVNSTAEFNDSVDIIAPVSIQDDGNDNELQVDITASFAQPVDISSLSITEGDLTVDEGSSTEFQGPVNITNNTDEEEDKPELTIDNPTTFNQSRNLDVVRIQNTDEGFGINLQSNDVIGNISLTNSNSDDSTEREFHLDNETEGLVRLGNYTGSFSLNEDGSLTHEFWNGESEPEKTATIWDSENDGEGSGLHADLLDGEEGKFYLEPENFYEGKKPNGQRIYVSSRYGDDKNYGFYPERPVKTISRAATNAFAVQAPDTLEGNIRKDVYRTLQDNRELIVEEIGLIANDALLCGNSRQALTYRDVDDVYSAISKDILLSTNENFRNVFKELYEVENNTGVEVANAWDTSISDLDGRTLLTHLKVLMVGVLYGEESDAEDKVSSKDFTHVSDSFINERLTHPSRDDSDSIATDDLEIIVGNTIFEPSDDGDPCHFIREELASNRYAFPTGREEDDLPTLIYPNQANKPGYSIIRIESGTYYERFPIELPDNASVFGDSLRRVEIKPTNRLKTMGCGLHQFFEGDTFTSLSNDQDIWENAIWVRYRANENGVPSSDSVFGSLDDVFSVEDFESEVTGRTYTIEANNRDLKAEGTVRKAEIFSNYEWNEIDTPDNTWILKLTFQSPTKNMDQFTPLEEVTITDQDTEEEESTILHFGEVFQGYLALKADKGDGEDYVNLINDTQEQGTLPRGTKLNTTIRFDEAPRFKLRKGDVLLIYDDARDRDRGGRYELVRVDQHKKDNDGNPTEVISIIPHTLNEELNLANSYVYIAPRAEWQTQCASLTYEGDFELANRSYPSTKVATNSELVGQNAFYVGNANYIFQVVFKDHTNFCFTFRRDRPTIYASPYIQNCSSLTSLGGGGILVDGFLPKQPDKDDPRPISDAIEDGDSTDNIFPYREENNSHDPINDIERLANLHYDGAQLINDNTSYVIDQAFEQSDVQDALDFTTDGVNYNGQEEKCREDAEYLLNAITFQMQRGGNDKVYDTAMAVRVAINNQVDPESDEALEAVRDAYETVISALRFHCTEIVRKKADNPLGEEELSGYIDDDEADSEVELCANVVSTVDTLWEIIRLIITSSSNDITNFPKPLDEGRVNHEVNPDFKITQKQTSELRSFVLDAFTQINVFGGWGHLIRNNGYAQLVSTFTTFCDQGIKLESGGLTNLSNSVSDFGFYGLCADGMSDTFYLSGNVAISKRGSPPGETPTAQVYIDPTTLTFNSENPVYSEREDGKIQQRINDWNEAVNNFTEAIESEDTETLENLRSDVQQARRALEDAATQAIQFNTTILFEESEDGVYDFKRDGKHLPKSQQIRRGLSYADSTDNISSQAVANGFELSVYEDDEVEIPSDLEILNPLVRVGFNVEERIPNATETNQEETPNLQEGTTVEFYITTTLTSSSHGFEYVGSGNDYSMALPENGGVPDASNQLLETNGGRVFVSSTDVRGDFRVGPFFTVKQSTGAVTFNPSSLELVNLTSIGPFRSNGIVGKEVIKDLTNDFNELISDLSGSDRTTIATVSSIKQALSSTFSNLETTVQNALDRSQSNAKLLESIQNPIPDFGHWAMIHSIHHREFQVRENDGDTISEGLSSETEWPTVRDLNSYLYELGGNVPEAINGDGNEFRNRASFTFNIVIDSSESMSKSGKFWQIKYDLINFFYNATERDSFGIYQVGDSAVQKAYLRVSNPEIIENSSEGDTVEIFDINSSGSRNIAYYDDEEVDFVAQDTPWYSEDAAISVTRQGETFTYYKVAEATVFTVLGDPQNKLGIEDISGYIREGQEIIVAGESGEIEVAENGYIPSVFNVNQGADEVRSNAPNFNFNQSIVNSLMKEIGVVFPTTSKVIEDNLIEPVVWNAANIGSLENMSEDAPNIAPGPNDFTSDETDAVIWPEEDFGPYDADYDFAEDDNITDENWFYADVNPSDDSASDVAKTVWEYLPRRTSVAERTGSEYQIGDIQVFSQYDPDDNPNGWLTAKDIEEGNFLKEQQSNPELDVAIVTHSSSFGDDNAQEASLSMIDFMDELDVLGIFNWKVAKLSAKSGIRASLRIKDFYLESEDESPRRDIFTDSGNEWRWGNDRKIKTGIDNNSLTLTSFDFAPDNGDGTPDLDNAASNTREAGVEGDDDASFWIGLRGIHTPIHPGTSLKLENRDTTADLDNLDEFVLDSEESGATLDRLVLSNPGCRLGPGDEVSVDIWSSESGRRYSFDYELKITIEDQRIGPNESGEVIIDPTDVWSILGIDPEEEDNGWGDSYRVDGNLEANLNVTNTYPDGDPDYDENDEPQAERQTHPLFDYQLEAGSTIDEDGNKIPTNKSFDWINRVTVPEPSLNLNVEGVFYGDYGEDANDQIWIKVSVDSGDSWEKNTDHENGSTTKSFGEGNLAGVDLEISPQGETLVGGGSGRDREWENVSTLKNISDACIELNWRPNSYKVLTTVSRFPSDREHNHPGGYYYASGAFTGSSSQEDTQAFRNRALLRRFDYVHMKFRENDASNLFEGEGLAEAFDQLDNGDISMPSDADLYDNDEFTSFIDSFTDVLVQNGAPVHAWYLGGTRDKDLNQITDESNYGGVSRNGTEIQDSDGNQVQLHEYVSYSSVQEDLIFAQIDQLNLATRESLYVDDSSIFHIDSDLAFGPLLNFHIPTNFNEPVINSILLHRTPTGNMYDSIKEINLDTGSGENPDGESNSNDFTSQWNLKQDLLPIGKWTPVDKVFGSNWLKNLVTEIEGALGEGSGVLYSEFGDGSNLQEDSNIADNAPGYRELISDGGYLDINDNLIKMPNPSILPSPSIDNSLMVNAPDSNPSPGITLGGRTAIYEAIATAQKDSSQEEERMLDDNPKISVEPRNPAREASINITAVISDGADNASFDSLVCRHFIEYEGSGKVTPSVEAVKSNLFYELFLDDNLHIQLDSEGRPIQQKFIYTAEILNSLWILSFDEAGGGSGKDNTYVELNSGFGDDNTSNVDLPFEVETPDTGEGSVFGRPGNREALARMVSSEDNDFPLVDSMKLVPPFYRSSEDAIPGLVPAELVEEQTGEINFSSLFPNPYRFVPYSFPLNESKQVSVNNLNIDSEDAKIFTSLGEEGPSISFTIDLTSINVTDNLIYNKASDNPEDWQADLPSRINVQLYSKLGYFHKITPKIEDQGLSSKLIMFDTGFGQKTSPSSQVLAQNLSGSDGTAFRNPSLIVDNELREGNIVSRNSDGTITYEQNPGSPLVDQRINYIENAFRNSARSRFTSGVPLISRRYQGTETSGEFAGNIETTENGDIFFTRVDENRNNRNSIFQYVSRDGSEFWEQIAGNRLGTGGKLEEIVGFQSIVVDANDNRSSVALIRDKEFNNSRVIILANDIWLTLIDTDTLVHDPIRDPEREDPFELNLQSQDYFTKIIQTNNPDDETMAKTHLFIKQGSKGTILSTKDEFTIENIRSGSIKWQLSQHDPDELFTTKQELDYALLDLERGEVTSDSIFAFVDENDEEEGYFGSFSGFYQFEFNFGLRRNASWDDDDPHIQNDDVIWDPDRSDIEDPNSSDSGVNGEYYLLANSQSNIRNPGGPLIEDTDSENDFENPQTWQLFSDLRDNAPGASRRVITVVGDADYDGDEYSDPNPERDAEYQYDSSTSSGVWLYDEAGLPILPNSGDNRLDDVRGDARESAGAWRKLDIFDQSNTLGQDTLDYNRRKVSQLFFDAGQELLDFDSIEADVDSDSNIEHLITVKKDTSDARNTDVLVAESDGLVVDSGTRSSWVSILDQSSDLTPFLGSDGDERRGSSEPIKILKTGAYFIIVFSDKRNRGDGNFFLVTDNPLTDFENIYWETITRTDFNDANSDSEGDMDYIEDAFWAGESDEEIVIRYRNVDGEKEIGIVTFSGNSTDLEINDITHVTLSNLLSNADVESVVSDELPDGVEIKGVTFVTLSDINEYFFSVASFNNQYSTIIGTSDINDADSTQKRDNLESDSPISYVPLIDPGVTPRFPHGQNWIRDGSIGVNQGIFSADPTTTADRSFYWNAPRYQNDDLYREIIDTVRNYRSTI